jgi:hypothetical protein
LTIDPRDDSNPFAAPMADIGHRTFPLDLENDSEAELVRRYHLSHEASIKSVGLLNYVLGGFSLSMAFALLLMSLGLIANPPEPGNGGGPLQGFFLIFAALFYGTLGTIAVALGYGIRRLQVWARWTTMILSALALAYLILMMVFVLAFLPVSNPVLIAVLMGIVVAILAYVFYLMVSPKGSMVFSAEYKQVIARTPTIKTRSSLIVKLLIGLLGFLSLFAVIGGIAQFFLRR